MKKSKLALDLFWTMFKIGLFTFGGGVAMISLFQSELIQRKKWLDQDEFLDIIAIAESTPGPIAINTATHVGYKMIGVLGSALATLGVVLPSFIIVYVISLFLDAFLTFTVVQYAFCGIQACVVYLIISAGSKMLSSIKKTPFNVIVLSAVFLCMIVFSVLSVNFSTILCILACGVLGVVVYLLGLIKNRGEKNK